jgi:hypothetical protein
VPFATPSTRAIVGVKLLVLVGFTVNVNVVEAPGWSTDALLFGLKTACPPIMFASALLGDWLNVELFRATATCQFEAGLGVLFVTVPVRLTCCELLEVTVSDAFIPVLVTAALDWPTSSSEDSSEDVGATHAASTAAAAKTIVD